MPQDTEIRVAKTVCVKLSVEIHAPLSTVWRCFLEDIAQWWSLANFAATRGTMILEAHAGGRLYERAENGHELLWGHVIEIIPRQRLFVHAAMGAPYAPACISLFQFNFETTDTGTRVSIRDELFGNVDEQTPASMTEGWTHLMTQGLKQYVESKRA